ncbi:hypothetical protein FGG08_007143, partial [Glutinoglossum americanum]
ASTNPTPKTNPAIFDGFTPPAAPVLATRGGVVVVEVDGIAPGVDPVELKTLVLSTVGEAGTSIDVVGEVNASMDVVGEVGASMGVVGGGDTTPPLVLELVLVLAFTVVKVERTDTEVRGGVSEEEEGEEEEGEEEEEEERKEHV